MAGNVVIFKRCFIAHMFSALLAVFLFGWAFLCFVLVWLFIAVHSGPVHTSPEEFENGGFTPISHQMFSVHTPLDEFKNATITNHFAFLSSGKYHDYRDFEKFRFQKVGVFKFLRFEEVFEKLRFRGRLVWTKGLTGERKLHFQIPLALCLRDLGFREFLKSLF